MRVKIGTRRVKKSKKAGSKTKTRDVILRKDPQCWILHDGAQQTYWGKISQALEYLVDMRVKTKSSTTIEDLLKAFKAEVKKIQTAADKLEANLGQPEDLVTGKEDK